MHRLDSRAVRPPLRSSRLLRERSRILRENRDIVVRIDRQKPTLSNRKLAEDRRKYARLLKNMGRFREPPQRPRALRTTSSRFLSPRGHSRERDESPLAQIIRPEYFSRTSRVLFEDSDEFRYQPLGATPALPRKRKGPKEIVLFSRNKDIDGQSYQFMVCRGREFYELRLAGGRSLRLRLGEEEGNRFFTAIGYDYQLLWRHCQIQQDSLALGELQEELESARDACTTELAGLQRGSPEIQQMQADKGDRNKDDRNKDDRNKDDRNKGDRNKNDRNRGDSRSPACQEKPV